MSDSLEGDGAEPVSALRLVQQERAQIAHEIHDALLPLIFAASAGVERLTADLRASQHAEPNSLDVGEQIARLNQVKSWLRDSMTVGRELLERTYPAELEQQDWQQALQAVVERQFGDRQLQWSIEPNARDLPRDVASVAYRVALEAVRNAVRHGNASEIKIAAAYQGTKLQLTVRDNGKGFDPAAVPSDRFGLRSMRGRASLIGGDLEVNSSPGGPTEVRLVVDTDRAPQA